MSTDLIKEYVNRSSWRIKSNANWNYSFSGLQSHIAGTILAKDALAHYGKIGKKHMDGSYHIHNLDAGIYGRYCNGNDLLGLLQRGLINVGGVTAKPAKHFSSCCDQITNFTYLMTGEFAGAQGWRDIDILLAPFIQHDGLNENNVKQELQQLIWNMSFNLRPGYQSPFVNFTFGLRPSKYYKELPVIIGGEIQKDLYSDFQDEIDIINNAFLDIMIEGPGDGKPFTFPLPTINITKDFKWDSEISNKIFSLASKWGSPYFSNYINTDLSEEDSLSMCPISGKERILIKSNNSNRFEFAEISCLGGFKNNGNANYEIYSNGKFIRGKFKKYNNQNMFKITLTNGHTITTTSEHLNFIMRNISSEAEVISTSDLNDTMYLPYSLIEYDGEGGIEELGFLVGCYAGDGCLEKNRIIFSLNLDDEKEGMIKKLIDISKKYFGSSHTIRYAKSSKLVTLSISSVSAVEYCKDFVKNKGRDKYYSPNIFGMSKEFRRGVLCGHIATDGSRRDGTISTSSIRMVECLNMLSATLGTTTRININNNIGRFSNYPNYSVYIYKSDRNSYGDSWFKKDNKMWFKIKNIKKSKKGSAYCFEVINDEPMFTVGTTGILTHNCRLRLNLEEVQRVSGGIWNFGANTGSLAVFTVNMPRIGYLSNGDEKKFFIILDKMLEDGKEYLLMKKECTAKGTKLGLFPMTNAYIGNKLAKTYFLTIGINGLNECSVNFCGEDILTNVNWCEEVLKHIAQRVLEFQQESGQLFNFEATPGEGCSYSLARLDAEKLPGIFTQGTEKAPYYTGSSLIPSHIEIGILDALEHQERLQKHYTGGTVFHIDMGDDAGCGPDGVRDMIRATCTNRTLPYITWSPSYGVCQTHGKQLGKVKCCSKSEIYSRVVGYYRSVDRWNIGKREEFSQKKFFKQMKPEDLKPIPHHLDEKGDVVIE